MNINSSAPPRIAVPPTHRSAAVLSLIGNTPCVPLHFQAEERTVWVKCEFLNPSGSVKDRFAGAVLLEAQARGELKPDSIVLECSSGNTGIALAMVGAALVRGEGRLRHWHQSRQGNGRAGGALLPAAPV